METWQIEGNPLKLGRFPYDNEEQSLRAWNGADILLTEHLVSFSGGNACKVLLLNDSFGALACAALKNDCTVHTQIDSALAREALLQNLKLNALDPKKVTIVDSLAPLDFTLWKPDLVLMHVPKGNAMLEYQLLQLSSSQEGGAGIALCAGAMTRDVHNSTIELFEKYIGETKTSLASHKARLIHSTFTRTGLTSPSPRIAPLAEPFLPALELVNYGGVFSASGHDRGSLLLLRYLAENTEKSKAVSSIIDCGCGNGLLALTAAALFPEASLICADESFMAVESSRAGFIRNGMEGHATFVWADCLHGIEKESTDLILCNPPFHQGNGQSQTLAIARRMFEHSRSCLKTGGSLLVVANRHLGHHKYLEQLFSRVTIVKENEQFMVIKAEKS